MADRIELIVMAPWSAATRGNQRPFVADLRRASGAYELSLLQYARVASEGPARTWGMYPRKGSISVGSDGDLTILDLDKTGIIDAARLHGKNNHNPFEGHRTTGEPVATIVRGQIVMRDGELVGQPRGRMVRPLE